MKGNREQATTLVLGGTGKTPPSGGAAAGARSTRPGGLALGRAAVRLGGPLDLGARAARRGVRLCLLLPDLAVPGAVETVGSFAELAVERGTRMVLLAGRGEKEAERAEQAVADSGAQLTIVRSTWFAQNFSEDYWAESILSGELTLPAGDTPEPFVDADDIADVAVAALTDDRHIGELYELTGPRLLTFAEAVDEIARALGREIRYIPISLEDFAAAAAAQGAPGEVIELLTYLFGDVLDGRNAHLADGVQRALGREPRDFGNYARAAAASGVWDRSRVGT
jgi:uncharacterized protein YbjT (DUF2867 family)